MNNGSDNCRTSALDYDSEQTQYSNTFSSAEISDQNERVLKELDKIKLTKILKSLTSKQPSDQCSMQSNFYGQNVDKSPTFVFNMENSCNASDSKIVTRSSARKCERNLSFKLNIGGNNQQRNADVSSSISSRSIAARKTPVQRREQSPDLFDDSDDDEVLEQSEQNVVYDKSKTVTWEKTLLKRLHNSLLGVLPPPSKTIVQHTSTELLNLYNENLLKMYECKGMESERSESLFKPTHTVEEVKNIEWVDMKLDVKCHGLMYNRSSDSEEIDLLCMKYLDRCVGVETSSSFTHTYRPSANKARMKLLSQSPGTRLSHLVGRKRNLSSASLLGKQCGSDSSKLGSKQMVIDVQ